MPPSTAMLPRRRSAAAATALVLPAVLALLVAGCARPSPSTGPSPGAPGPGGNVQAARPAADLVLAGNPERRQVRVIGAGGKVLRTMPAGVPSPDWRTLYVAAPARGRTTVAALDVASGRVLRSTSIAGRFELPSVGTAAVPDGLSGDGGTLALSQLGDGVAGRFAILRTDFKQPAELVDLRGDFEFDALSPNGSRLYVIEHLAGPDRSRYRVRAYDLATRKLDPNAIVSKGDVWEKFMVGYPNTRVTGVGGVWIYTLYRNAAHPFVHALNAQDGYAFCIDLPGGGDDRSSRLWTLAGGGGRLYAVNTALGKVSQLDAEQQFTVTRTASFPPQPPAFGTAARPGSVVLGDNGEVLLAGGPSGLLAIGTGPLALEHRYLDGWAVDGLVASADGSRVYALSSARARVATIDPASGALLGERPAPSATVLLHATD
jgi:hypothetical protein